jgi:hypothetical protein
MSYIDSVQIEDEKGATAEVHMSVERDEYDVLFFEIKDFETGDHVTEFSVLPRQAEAFFACVRALETDWNNR